MGKFGALSTIQLIWEIFLNIQVAAWVEIYNGIHEFKTITCNNVNCIYGFRNSMGTEAQYLNCPSTPLTAVLLQNNQLFTILLGANLAPTQAFSQQMILFDIYFTNQWAEDIIKFQYNNEFIFEIKQSTNNPLTFNYGLCGAMQYQVKTFVFILPKTSNASIFAQFQIVNSAVQAMIRNMHVSYLECFPSCSQCTGPLKTDCTQCQQGMTLNNGECRCPIRKSVLTQIGCVDQCSLFQGRLKPSNRICTIFYPNTISPSRFYQGDYSQIQNWNIIYDPRHIDITDKKLAPYYLGVFKYYEGAYISVSSQWEPYPLAIFVQIVFCNSSFENSGIQFLINQELYGSVKYDGVDYQYNNVVLRSLTPFYVIGQCKNNLQMELELFFKFYQKNFLFSIIGNFSQDGAGWFLRWVDITNGQCPNRCLKCNQQFICAECFYGYLKTSDGICLLNYCATNTTWNGTHCVWFNERTKYTKYLVKEFYDYTVTDTMRNLFILESQTPNDLQKGQNIFWSYEAKTIVFGGKYVWARARFSQIYILKPHHSLTLYFQIVFGLLFPNSPSNYLQYEINNSTIKKIFLSSNLVIVEEISFYNPKLSIALECFGVNVVDSYCAISNYYIAVHYCKPFCLKCTNEFDCQEWDSYDSAVVKLIQSDCASNQFLDEDTFTCETCSDECLTCFNEYECLSCQNNYHLYKTTCLLDCLVHQYYDGITCQDCLYSCKQCTAFSDCIHCEAINLRYLQDGQCICYDGYYDQLNTPQCLACNIICKTCNGPTNSDCISCISLTNVIQIGQNCKCQDGYYFDSNQIKCQLCSNLCQTCYGNSNSNCLSCYSSQFRQLEGFQCSCQEGYYEDNSQCLQCPNGIDILLLKCFKDCGDGTQQWFNLACNPISCQAGFQNLNDKCIPICGDNLINGDEECDDGNSIQFDGCYNCRFQCPIQCTTCNSATIFPCPNICGDGYTSGEEECDDGNNVQYDGCYQCKLECQIQCTKCLKGLCSECQTFGWMLNPSTRLCIENCGDRNVFGKEECDDGYNFDSNDGCLNCKFLCRNDCLICSANGNSCLECKAIGFKPSQYFCINICGDGYVAVDPYNRYFEQCDDFNVINNDGCSSVCQFQCQPTSICTSCINNRCQSCISTYYLDASKNKCIELCNDTQIVGNEKCEDMNNQMNDGCYNCQLSCQPSCQTCTIIGCQLCKIGYQLIGQTCKNICGDKIQVKDEDCDDGNLNPFDGCHLCKFFCDSSCKVCYNGRCLECEKGFKKVHFKCIYIQNSRIYNMIEKLENYNIFGCQVQFKSTCLKCLNYFDLNSFNNYCYYKQQSQDFQVIIRNNHGKFLNIFKSKELNCKYNLNDQICIECQNGFTLNSINNRCNYQDQQIIRFIDGINIYDKLLNLFKAQEFDCKFSINNNYCLECNNNFSLNLITNQCSSHCGDNLINGQEQCEDQNQLEYDGCFDCQYQCCEYCQICQFAKCQKCMGNYFLVSETKCEIKLLCEEVGFYYDDNKNECYDICGDGIISKNEECDDGNNIPFDGCYKCQYQCSKSCQIQEKGECLASSSIQCELGFYYFFENQQCQSICGDGILVLSFEECDDGNDQKDDECDNCLLQCNKFCQVCLFQNLCSICKENYELVNQICQESQNSQCQIENCQECNNDFCTRCLEGFILIYGICQSICGDGILVGTEQCDDGNLINGDGCDQDCLPSKNFICKNQECIIVNPPSAKLIYLYERQGEQFVMLQYNQKMRVCDGCNFEDYLESLDFQFQGEQTDVVSFSFLNENQLENSESKFEIKIKIHFYELINVPKLILTINDTQLLVNDDGLSIEQNSIYSLDLIQPNVLNNQQLKSLDTLVNISESNLKVLAFFIALASITGQLEIIENILDTIQQLYYLKYIKSRIGYNLEQYFQAFKIIQLANLLDYLNINIASQLDFNFKQFNSEQVFQDDDRNANFFPNIIQISSVLFIFTIIFYFLKQVSKNLILFTQNLKVKFLNKGLLQIVNYVTNQSIKISKKKYLVQFQYVFSALIYEYSIFTTLALRYSSSDAEGIIGFSFALIIFYFVFLKLAMMLSYPTQFKLELVQETNKYIYTCFSKFCFMISLVFFYNTSTISIFLNLLNELIICYSIYQFKIFESKSENIKKFIHHMILFCIFLMYIINEFSKDNTKILILIAWVIIALMTLTLIQTTLIDLFTLMFPLIEKLIFKLKLQQKKTSNEIMSTISVIKEGIQIRQLM